MDYASVSDFEAGFEKVRACPADGGVVRMIVARPETNEREVLGAAEFVIGEGLVGDNYLARGDSRRPDGSAHPEAQLNLMNAVAVDTVAMGDQSRWPLAGDQLFVDFDLSVSNIPTGTRLAIGSAVIEVSAKPHNGCNKFAERFGVEAARWVNSDKEVRLRGINAMVVQSGTVTTGDKITKL